MVHCQNCGCDREVEVDDANGFSCCAHCGRILDDVAFSADLMFQKGGDGETGMVGQILGQANNGPGNRFTRGAYAGGDMEGRESSAARGYAELSAIAEHFHMQRDVTDAAHRLYKLALTHGFTRGRRVNQVAATCLYIVCRQENKPLMLIDFSDHLSVNVFSLGSVYLQLLRLFRLDTYPVFTKPIDPSLYLHRFTERLRLGPEKAKEVGATALHLVQSMKRDWMQTGRRPSGICGAALFIAAHIHGFQKSKMDVISVVHVGWTTIERRIKEFANTAHSEMTLQEFEDLARGYGAAEELEGLEGVDSRLMLPSTCHARGAAGGARAREQLAASGLNPNSQTANAEAEAQGHLTMMGRGRGDYEGQGQGSLALVVVGDTQPGAGAGAEAGAGPSGAQAAGASSLTFCEHVVHAGSVVFAHRMCRECFISYLDTSGGIHEGSSNPPSFTLNLRRELRAKIRAIEEEEIRWPIGGAGGGGGGSGGADREVDEDAMDLEEALRSSELAPITRALMAKGGKVGSSSRERSSSRGVRSAAGGGGGEAGPSSSSHGALIPSSSLTPLQTLQQNERQRQLDARDTFRQSQILPPPPPPLPLPLNTTTAIVAVGEPQGAEREDNLSDMDDDEEQEILDSYIATKEEAELKGLLWREMNKDWLEKQSAKEATAATTAAATAAAAEAAATAAGPEGAAATAVAVAALAAVAASEGGLNDAAAGGARGGAEGTERGGGGQGRKKREAGQKRKAGGAAAATAALAAAAPAATASEAAFQMFEARKLSNKINYNALGALFDNPGNLPNLAPNPPPQAPPPLASTLASALMPPPPPRPPRVSGPAAAASSADPLDPIAQKNTDGATLRGLSAVDDAEGIEGMIQNRKVRGSKRPVGLRSGPMPPSSVPSAPSAPPAASSQPQHETQTTGTEPQMMMNDPPAMKKRKAGGVSMGVEGAGLGGGELVYGGGEWVGGEWVPARGPKPSSLNQKEKGGEGGRGANRDPPPKSARLDSVAGKAPGGVGGSKMAGGGLGGSLLGSLGAFKGKQGGDGSRL